MNTHMLSRTLQLLFILALLTPAHAQIVGSSKQLYIHDATYEGMNREYVQW